MSTTTDTSAQDHEPTPGQPFRSVGAGLRFGAVVRSELMKLIGLRTTIWLSVLTLGFSAFFATVFSWATSMPGAAEAPQLDLASSAVAGLFLGLFLLGALGIISFTTEFNSGSIRSSLSAVPRRSTLFVGKASALALWVALIALVSIIIGHLLTVLLSDLELSAPVTDHNVFWFYLSNIIITVLTALLGLGLGALLRSAAGGIVVLVIILFVLDTVLVMATSLGDLEWIYSIMPYTYSSLSNSFTYLDSSHQTAIPAEGNSVGVWGSGLGLLIWTAIPMAIGWLSFTRRDA